MLTESDINELVGLVVKAQAEEMIDGMLIENSPSARLISLKQLEMKLYRMRSEMSSDR